MPYKMHERRQFGCTHNGERYVCVLDISRFGSIIEEFRYRGDNICEHSRAKIDDIHYEGGTLVINTKKGLLSIFS